MYNYSPVLSYRTKSDTVYRKELLDCFNMTEYSDEINKKMDILYNSVKEYYSEIIALIKQNNPFVALTTLDDKDSFMLLFSWEYFYENHQLLVEIYNKTDKIGEKKTILLEKIKSQNK